MSEVETIVWNNGNPPMDGTWIRFEYNAGVRVQYDATAFGGKGGWFNEKGHAQKVPPAFTGWAVV